MATAGDERSPYVSRGDVEMSRKRPFRPEIIEELHNASQEAEQNNPTEVPDEGGSYASMSVTVGKSELEQILKQMTFTRQQQPTTIENLSGDLLSNIFIRLLAKQLARMRSVSKSWNALLSQPAFVKSHLNYSINNNDQILVVSHRYNIFSSFDFKSFSVHSCRSPRLELELTNFIKLPPVDLGSGHNPRMLEVIGSVHGLICSRYGNDVIHIWNPSLSAVSTLPPYSIPSGYDYKIYFRFGYDPKTDDYKVDKLVGLSSAVSSYVIAEWLQVEVYSMRKGSWKSITERFPSHVARISKDDYVCHDGHDGHIHWLGDIGEYAELQTIVSYDLGSETFRLIPLPDATLEIPCSNALGVFGGKLCVVSWVEVYLGWDVGCEVWVMDEYGLPESWVKRHVFSQFVIEFSYGFTSRNGFVFRDGDFRLVLYDPISNDAKILKKSSRGSVTCPRSNL